MSTHNSIRFCAILLATENQGNVVHDQTCLRAAQALATQCAGTAEAIVIGPGAGAGEWIQAACALGVDHLWVATGEAATRCAWQAPQVVDLLASLILSPQYRQTTSHATTVYLIDADATHEEIGARLAVHIDALPLGRCQQITLDESGALCVTQSVFGGRLRVTRRLSAGIHIAALRQGLSVQTTQSPEKAHAARPPHTTHHQITLTGPVRPDLPVLTLPRAEQHASLEGAKLVMSGGRGIGCEAGFTLLYQIADQLDGAVSASLPAVDAGWAPIARQVGQPGKYIRPDIYVAVGISGTPQHMAGIDPHTRIVAINKDPEAPIFNMAQLGIVGDWETILPALSEALKT